MLLLGTLPKTVVDKVCHNADFGLSNLLSVTIIFRVGSVTTVIIITGSVTLGKARQAQCHRLYRLSQRLQSALNLR